MVLMKEFKRAEIDDYEELSVVTGSMRLVLKGLHRGMIPHESYSIEEIASFCSSLIRNQKPDGSWQVFSDDYSLPEEEENDFLYFPTQIACAVLSHVKQKLPTPGIEGIDEAISAGLKFSVKKNLEGYGFNTRFQLLESLVIFIEGSVAELLNSDPRICPPCYNRLIELKQEIQSLLEKGETLMEYGGDYREHYEYVLEGLKNI